MFHYGPDGIRKRLLRPIICDRCFSDQDGAKANMKKPPAPKRQLSFGNGPSGDRQDVERMCRWYSKPVLEFSKHWQGNDRPTQFNVSKSKAAPEMFEQYKSAMVTILEHFAQNNFEHPTDDMLKELAFGSFEPEDNVENDEDQDEDQDEKDVAPISTAEPSTPKPVSMSRRIQFLINSYCGRNNTARLDKISRGIIEERKVDFDRTNVPDDKYAVISVDAGIRNAIAASYDVGTKYEKTVLLKNRHYKEMSGRGRQQKTYEEAIADNPDVQEALWLHQTGETNPESFQIMRNFGNTTRRPVRFQSFRRRQIFYTDLISRLLDPIALRGRIPIVIWGDGKFNSSWKGYVSVPNAALVKEIAKRCVVVLVDEYRTSQQCSACLLFSLQSSKPNRGLIDSMCTTNLKLGTYRYNCRKIGCKHEASDKLCKRNQRGTVKARQHCATCRLWQPFRQGHTTWNRDENSARLIGIRFLYRLRNGGAVPPTLDRGFVAWYRQMKQDDLLAKIARDAGLDARKLEVAKHLRGKGKANAKIRADIREALDLATKFMRFLKIGIWRREVFKEWEEMHGDSQLEAAWSTIDQHWPLTNLASEEGGSQQPPGARTF